MTVERQMVGRHAWGIDHPVVDDALGNEGGRRGKLKETGRSRSVVEIFVPLISQRAHGQYALWIGVAERGEIGPPPEPHPPIGFGDEDVGRALIDREDLTAHGVLRARAVVRRSQTWVAPRGGRNRMCRIE